MKPITVIRKEHFNAAHRLHNPNWSDEKNTKIFGKCNNPNFHGHNYDLDVMVSGLIDPETGYLIDMKLLSNLIKSEVLDYMDHKNLNLDVSEFKNLNPTAENIAIVIYNRIDAKLPDNLNLKIRLYETQRNIVEYPA
ncbi:MAG: 6-pyruvoyl tetrahydrobiopterin synthase [Crocinitomicaceae bacterium]|nr:6-pyruvoyl tetrahydrobiopterin synthase [Crocinitomicaceae bacterium]